MKGEHRPTAPARPLLPTLPCPLHGCMELLRHPGISGRLQDMGCDIGGGFCAMIQANSGPSQELDSMAIRASVRPMDSVIAKGLQVTSGIIVVRKPSTQAFSDAGLGQMEKNTSTLGLVEPSCSPRGAGRGLTTSSWKVN